MDTKTILNEASGRMQKAIDHLEEELLNVRAGKASPNALNGIMVDYFGSQVPVSGAASVTVPDAKTILIQPWDKNMLRPLEKAIIDSNIGLTPSNNGEQIRLSIPPLTEERRRELLARLARCHEEDESVEYLQHIVENEGGMEKAARVMQEYLTRAMSVLSEYEPSEYRDALANLCVYVGERDR